MWPVLVLLGLQCLGLGIALAQHGTPQEDYHSVWPALIATLLLNAVLYWGGWFDVLFHQPPVPC